MRLKTIGIILLAVGGFILLRSLFPKTVTVVGAPRIVTQYDTVKVIDTAWVTRLRRDTLKVNVTERVTITVPETIYVLPRVERGITAVAVGEHVGDSTLVGGFTLTPLDSGISRQAWTVQFYTLGPVKSLVLDSLPRLTFYAPPKPSCGVFCKLGHYVIGASVGFGLAAILK